jgi:hypothetical protein
MSKIASTRKSGEAGAGEEIPGAEMADTPEINENSGSKSPISGKGNTPETLKLSKLEEKLLKNGKFDKYILLPTNVS